MSQVQELKQIWHANTVVPVEQHIPVPELPAEQELQLWRAHLFEQLKACAAKGEQHLDLVYVTATRYKDETRNYARVEFSESMCAVGEPPQLTKWLVDWCDTDDGYNMETCAQESHSVLYVGTLLQNYLRQLLGPELEACAAFSRVRPAGPKDGASISHYVEYGLFLDWSDDASDESVGKKSKTSE